MRLLIFPTILEQKLDSSVREVGGACHDMSGEDGGAL